MIAANQKSWIDQSLREPSRSQVSRSALGALIACFAILESLPLLVVRKL